VVDDGDGRRCVTDTEQVTKVVENEATVVTPGADAQVGEPVVVGDEVATVNESHCVSVPKSDGLTPD
jgi:hypothetical protein